MQGVRNSSATHREETPKQPGTRTLVTPFCSIPSESHKLPVLLFGRSEVNQMSDDFETTIRLNELDIEILGNLLVQRVLDRHRKNPGKAGDPPGPESLLLKKILDTRRNQLIDHAPGRP